MDGPGSTGDATGTTGDATDGTTGGSTDGTTTSDARNDTTGGQGTADEEADMPVSTLDRPPVSVAARMLLERSRAGLLQACAARSCGERYVAAHLAALRAGAAVLAVRGRATTRGGPRSVWDVLPRVAPELTEWAAFFAATASRRAAVEAGRGEVISARDADDLLRDAETFHHVVETTLGLPYQPVLPGALPTCT